MNRLTKITAGIVLGAVISSPAAAYWEIDFSTFGYDGSSTAVQHGQIMDSEYSGTGLYDGIPGLPGVQMSIQGVNWSETGHDHAVAWNPFSDDTSDRDLWAPFYPGPYGSPNNPGLPVLDTPAELGNILILQEHDVGSCDPSANTHGACDTPDDEGNRPAGYFEFTFSEPVSINALDFVDIEREEGEDDQNTEIYFWSSADGTTGGKDTTGGGQYAIMNGDKDHWHTPITGGESQCNETNYSFKQNRDGSWVKYCNTWDRKRFNLSNVIKFRIEMGGSGGLTKISGGGKKIPEPATLALFAAGLIGLYLIRRRRQAVTAS